MILHPKSVNQWKEKSESDRGSEISERGFWWYEEFYTSNTRCTKRKGENCLYWFHGLSGVTIGVWSHSFVRKEKGDMSRYKQEQASTRVVLMVRGTGEEN